MEQKKFYEKPETEVVEIATAQILCYSGEGTDESGEGAPEFNW